MIDESLILGDLEEERQEYYDSRQNFEVPNGEQD